MVEAISGAKPARQAILGDASNRNKNSGILTLCLLAGGVLFRPLAIRHDVIPGHRRCDTPGSQKAPSAKRCIKTSNRAPEFPREPKVRKHRAPKGALRSLPGRVDTVLVSQKAPSAKRCIKTLSTSTAACVSRQKAPSAKRCIKTMLDSGCPLLNHSASQKAPSAKRRIKT